MNTMKKSSLVSLLVACAVGNLSADELSSNIEQPSAGTESVSVGRSLAARFNTDTDAHELTSVTLEIEAPSNADVTVSIYSDQGFEPGNLIGSFSNPTSLPTSLGLATFAASGINLEASASYWVVMSSDDAGVSWAWSDSNDGEGDGFSTEWGVTDETDPEYWWTQDIYPLKMAVTVDEASSCIADVNGDGVLSFFDISAFVTLYNDGDAAVDFTDDGQLNFFDVSAFLAAYNAGCP